MTEKPVRPSEDPIRIFISSRQDEEMSRARDMAIKEAGNYPGMVVWAFEDAAASPETARDRYIRNAGAADIVIWLIGSSTTTPIVEEISACLRVQGKLLAFKLPADGRDEETEALIQKVSGYATWKTVENVDDLPANIRTSLTDEMLRRYRDPAPVNHDLFLKQKLRESIAETKRLWTTLGVPDDIAAGLADDHSVGHKLTIPATGMLTVTAQQGSGKTLAAHRLYQLALQNRLQDHSSPLPIFLNARNISGELKDQIEGHTQEQGTVYTQAVLVIIDGLDETGRQKANQLISQAKSYTDANGHVAAVLMMRPLPGLSPVEDPFVLPECDDKELLSIASKIAGREVHRANIPFWLWPLQNRLPLFAAMAGTYLRQPIPPWERTPDQNASGVARRIMGDSEHHPPDTEEFLKRLAVESIASGEAVDKASVAPRVSDQDRIAESRIVVEERGRFDFTLAIFREWFAARALVERSVTLDDIELTSDRWVVPLAIAINLENAHIGPEIMEKLTTEDPGMAGLVLYEVKHNWSTDNPENSLPPGTVIELGSSIRNAMENWGEGLGPLMPALGMLDQGGNIPTLGIEVQTGWVTTSWYRGSKELPAVVQLPDDLRSSRGKYFEDWPGPITSRGIESTRVWPWSLTHKELSRLLQDELRSLRLALDSPDGFHEFAYEFASHLHRSNPGARNLQTPNEVIDFIEKQLSRHGGDPRTTVTFGYREYSFTFPELELFRERVSNLSRNGTNFLVDPWPGPDKEWPVGRSGILWSEIYTEERLVQRTSAIYNAALRIYNDIVERRFPAFNKRTQMSYALPFWMRGIIRLHQGQEQRQWRDHSLMYWTEQADSKADSGVFIELEPKGQTTEDESAEQRIPRYSGWRVLPGHEPRPATKLAHEWLTHDINALRWDGW